MTPIFSPLAETEFDAYKAAHLLWRAGFGGTWDDAENLAKRGLKGAVDWLVNYPKVEPEPPPDFAKLVDEKALRERTRDLTKDARKKIRNESRQNQKEDIDDLKFWWLNRMLTTKHPLEEKMTLFWHGHFASSFADKIRQTYPMWQQNEMFRENALAPFPALLKKVIRNPAMLVWLDNSSNHKGHANENLGREFMELFTLGVGNFTEPDVKAGSRAFTGYTVDRDDWTFRFNKSWHDETVKTYLGETGNFDGDDVVDIICEQKACARFMTHKFWEYFVYENPEPEVHDAAAKLYRASGYDTKSFLTKLFQSQIFYSHRAMNSVIKSPVILTIGALKSMRLKIPDSDVLLGALRLMGQDLFFPPLVNGWPGGRTWINSNTLLIRYNYANYLLNGVNPDKFKVFDPKTDGSIAYRRKFVEKQRKEVDWNPLQQLKDLGLTKKLTNTNEIVDYYIREFLQRPVANDDRQHYLNFAETSDGGSRAQLRFDDIHFNERIRGLAHLIMSSPDYQLC